MRITFFYTHVTSLYQTQVWLTRLASKFRLARDHERGRKHIAEREREREDEIWEIFACSIDLIEEFVCLLRWLGACWWVNSVAAGREGEKGEKHVTKRNFAPTILGSRGRGGTVDGQARFYTNRRVFSKLIFPGSYGCPPRVLSPLAGAKLVLCHGPAEFPERVVNRIMKTSEPPCVGTPQSFVPTFYPWNRSLKAAACRGQEKYTKIVPVISSFKRN